MKIKTKLAECSAKFEIKIYEDASVLACDAYSAASDRLDALLQEHIILIIELE